MTDISRRGMGAALGIPMLVLGEPVLAQARGRPPAAPARPAAPATPTPSVPPAIAVLAMVRSTLLAVDHANRTGNYTVLRDLAAPQFRDANSAARLAQIFGPVVTQSIDLLAVAVAEPAYNKPAAINAEHKLHVGGVFRIPPKAAAFEIMWEPVGAQWRLFAVGIQPA